MATIKIEDLNTTVKVSDQQAADVKGGPAFMKLGDIKGEVRSTDSVPLDNFSLNFEKVRF